MYSALFWVSLIWVFGFFPLYGQDEMPERIIAYREATYSSTRSDYRGVSTEKDSVVYDFWKRGRYYSSEWTYRKDLFSPYVDGVYLNNIIQDSMKTELFFSSVRANDMEDLVWWVDIENYNSSIPFINVFTKKEAVTELVPTEEKMYIPEDFSIDEFVFDSLLLNEYSKYYCYKRNIQSAECGNIDFEKLYQILLSNTIDFIVSRTYYDVGVELIFQKDTVVIKQEMARPGIHRWEISIGADKKRFFVFNPLITRYVKLLLPPRLRKDYYYSPEESIMREYFKGG